jgi:hypothetical protein
MWASATNEVAASCAKRAEAPKAALVQPAGAGAYKPSFVKILDEPQKVGLITDIRVWTKEGQPVVGVLGTYGAALLARDGTVRREYPIKEDAVTTYLGCHQWVGEPGQEPVGILSVEEMGLREVSSFDFDGNRRWRWKAPKDLDIAFGLQLVMPLHRPDGKLATLVTSGKTRIILDDTGNEVERRPWIRIDACLVRPLHSSVGVAVACSSDASLYLINDRGEVVQSVTLPKPNSYVNELVPLQCDAGSDEFYVGSTYGKDEERYSIVTVTGQAARIKELPLDQTAAALRRRQCIVTRSRLPQDSVKGFSRAMAIDGLYKGLYDDRRFVDIAIGEGDLQRFSLPLGDAHARHLYSSVMVAVPGKDGGDEELWVGWGSRLSKIVR